MDSDKDKWIEDVFNSINDIQRAKPDSALFSTIEKKIINVNSNVIPISYWRNYVAASILVLLLNTTALIWYHRNEAFSTTDELTINLYNDQITTSYQIYK